MQSHWQTFTYMNVTLIGPLFSFPFIAVRMSNHCRVRSICFLFFNDFNTVSQCTPIHIDPKLIWKIFTLILPTVASLNTPATFDIYGNYPSVTPGTLFDTIILEVRFSIYSKMRVAAPLPFSQNPCLLSEAFPFIMSLNISHQLELLTADGSSGTWLSPSSQRAGERRDTVSPPVRYIVLASET